MNTFLIRCDTADLPVNSSRGNEVGQVSGTVAHTNRPPPVKGNQRGAVGFRLSSRQFFGIKRQTVFPASGLVVADT